MKVGAHDGAYGNPLLLPKEAGAHKVFTFKINRTRRQQAPASRENSEGDSTHVCTRRGKRPGDKPGVGARVPRLNSVGKPLSCEANVNDLAHGGRVSSLICTRERCAQHAPYHTATHAAGLVAGAATQHTIESPKSNQRVAKRHEAKVRPTELHRGLAHPRTFAGVQRKDGFKRGRAIVTTDTIHAPI